jgi:hypothetical protein
MFTVGCLHFGVRGEPGAKFTGAGYLDAIRDLFEQSSNVAEVDISAPDKFSEEVLVVPAVPPTRDRWNTGKGLTMVEGNDVFPNPMGMTLDVTFRIPLRVQRESIPDELENWVAFPSEEYRLLLHYKYGLPVAVVVPVGANTLNEAQDAMVIVREFITRNLVQPDGFLFLDTVGPSPFHADFFVRQASGASPDRFAFSTVRHARGPDEVIFDFAPAAYPDAESAFPDVMVSIEDEVEFFYSVLQGIQFDMFEWGRIDAAVESLIDQHRAHGVKGTLQRLRAGSAKITDAIIDLSTFERRQLFERQGTESRYDRNFPPERVQYLKVFVIDQLRQHDPYPVAQTAELVRSFERWRTSAVGGLTATVSALGGAAVGVLLTQLFS